MALGPGKAHAVDMSATDPRDEYEALVHAAERIASRFPLVPEETVLELVADEWTNFDQAKLRAFVPVLVEGGVVRRLRSTGQHDVLVDRMAC